MFRIRSFAHPYSIIMQLSMSSCKAKITAISTVCSNNYPNVRKPSGRQRFSSFSMLKAKIFLIENSLSISKAKICLIENLLSISKGFLGQNYFNDPKVRTIHRDYLDYGEKDVRNSILWPAVSETV